MLTMISWLLAMHLMGQSAIIQGKVMDEQSHELLTGVIVTLVKADLHTTTDDQGQYAFDNVKVGNDSISLMYTGYEMLSEPITIQSGEVNRLIQFMTPGRFELEQIQVTAQPDLQTKVIADVDIRLRSTRTSQDILRMVPGLFIAQHAGGGKAEQIFLRGFDIDHGTDIEVSTDGMPVNMVSHAHGQGYADLHFLIPETVNRVHFGKGPYHMHHGNLATAGYVGFETFNTLDENTLSFQVGQFNSYRGLGLVSLLDQEKAYKHRNAYIAGEYNTTDGYFDSPQDFQRINLFGKYIGSLGHASVLSFSASTFSSHWNASGQIPLRAIESGQIGFFGSIDDTEGGETSRSNANLRLSTTLPDGSWLKNQVYYSNYQFELYSNFTFFLNDSINGDQIKQKEKRNLFGYNGSYSREDQWLGKGITSEIGWLMRNDLSDDNELSHTAQRTTIIDRLAFGDIHETNIGAYLNETIRLTDRFTINTGLRYDHFIFGYDDHLTNAPKRTVNDDLLSPKLNAYYQLTDHLQLSGNVGYGFHSNDTRVVVRQEGFKDLPRAMGTDIGALWKPFSKLILSATLWRLTLDQEFVYVGDEAVVELSGKTVRKGAEFSGRLEVLKWLFADLDLNYTIARSAVETKGQDYIPLAPKFSSIGGLTVVTNKHWSGSLRYRSLGDRAANEDNSIIAEGYTVFDVVLGYRVKKYEFGLTIDNVFDTRWREAQFDTESRLAGEHLPVSEIHFTPGTPFSLRANVAYHF